MYKWDLSLPPEIKLPNHIALIPDGNRRWAKARGLNTLKGHEKGFSIAIEDIRFCWMLGVNTVSLWFFSTENWNRSKEEVDYLMKLYEWLIKELLKDARKYGVRLVHLGRKETIPSWLLKAVENAEEETKKNKKHFLNMCLDYGGQDEILRTVGKMMAEKVDPQKLTKEVFESFINTTKQPYFYPDLIVRTSGEQRLSGFMSWQSSYAEFYFSPVNFPDFTPEKLKMAILDFNYRERRFGGN